MRELNIQEIEAVVGGDVSCTINTDAQGYQTGSCSGSTNTAAEMAQLAAAARAVADTIAANNRAQAEAAARAAAEAQRAQAEAAARAAAS